MTYRQITISMNIWKRTLRALVSKRIQKGICFRTALGKSDALTRRPMSQADAYRMIRRRAKSAGILTKIENHTFRATGITAYLRNLQDLLRAAGAPQQTTCRSRRMSHQDRSIPFPKDQDPHPRSPRDSEYC